jgi:hypothetical protein
MSYRSIGGLPTKAVLALHGSAAPANRIHAIKYLAIPARIENAPAVGLRRSRIVRQQAVAGVPGQHLMTMRPLVTPSSTSP